MAVLEGKGLHKTYDSDGVAVHALRGADLALDEGELVALMGPSGCGKSTLLHLLGGLDTPSSGQVVLDGVPLADLSDRELTRVRRHRIGFVFQFFNLVPVLTAAENVSLPAVIDGQPTEERDRRVAELLDRVGLTDRADHVPARLSGGEQQRVAIARALLNRPAVLLADEPTGNLDRRSGAEVMQLIARANADDGQTVLVVTHDPNVAAVAGRVVLLRDGAVVDELRPGGSDRIAALAAALAKLDEH